MAILEKGTKHLPILSLCLLYNDTDEDVVINVSNFDLAF